MKTSSAFKRTEDEDEFEDDDGKRFARRRAARLSSASIVLALDPSV